MCWILFGTIEHHWNFGDHLFWPRALRKINHIKIEVKTFKSLQNLFLNCVNFFSARLDSIH